MLKPNVNIVKTRRERQSCAENSCKDFSLKAIEFDNVCFSYGSQSLDGHHDGESSVLDHASFTVDEGEFIALVGNNGSGKSTITKMVDAFIAPDYGTARVLDCDIGNLASKSDVYKLRRDIGFVFQNPDDQLVAPLVIDEVAFGPRQLGLPKEDIIARIENALNAVDMIDAIGRDVNTLSGGQRQRIAIADALAMQPKLLILDEPTSMLDAQNRKSVTDIVQHLHKEGITILLVTHNPEEAMLADRVLEIKNGKVLQADCSTWEKSLRINTPKPSMIKQKEKPTSANLNRKAAAKPIICFDNVSFRYGPETEKSVNILGSTPNDKLVLENINLQVFDGEFLAIAGPNGSGKTTLIQHMNGLLQPTCGEVTVDGMSTATQAGANAARRKVGVVFQYPERSLFAQTVAEDVAFGLKNKLKNELRSNPKSSLASSSESNDHARENIKERVHSAMDAVGLPYEDYANRNPFNLSGGEQRKAAIAGVIAASPQVLVLDEPCAGMDLEAHAQLMNLFAQLHQAGQTIVLVTHDEQDIATMTDRVFRF